MKKINKFFRNIDLRKFFGTIIGGAFFLCCVAYFTYAYYEWKSDETSIALTIHEADVKCTMGPNVDVSNIGPVLKMSDGVKSSFAIENSFTDDIAISIILDIISISDSLLTESFKWAIVQENESNFDYDNPIIEGSFKNFREGSNLIITALQVPSQKKVNYEFIVYIDGNMNNDIVMMQNSMEASLTLGNCGTDYIRYDELTQFAFYSEDDNSLTFTYDYPRKVGETYLGKTVTNLYIGYDTSSYGSYSSVPWSSISGEIISVVFEEKLSPISTKYWFNSCYNLININMEKLDTSKVTDMWRMFAECKSITHLDVSHFDTSNVRGMGYLLSECNNLVSIDVSNFDTRNVTDMARVFHQCLSLENLDVSNFDTSNVERMNGMFYGCSSLKELDLSNFDTSKTTNMSGMFIACKSLEKLDLSNFDTSKVTNMASMFGDSNKLESLNISNFDTSKVTKMSYMFGGCNNLTNLDLSNFDIKKVVDMGMMLQNALKINTSITINCIPSNVIGYSSVFNKTSTEAGTSLTVYYVADNPNTIDVNESTYDLVEAMIATKASNSNVINGGCKGDYCPAVEEENV